MTRRTAAHKNDILDYRFCLIFIKAFWSLRIIVSILQRGNWSTERSSNLPEATEPWIAEPSSFSFPPFLPSSQQIETQCQSRPYGIVTIACPGLDRQCLFPCSKGEDSQVIPNWMYKSKLALASLCFKIKRLFMFFIFMSHNFYRMPK